MMSVAVAFTRPVGRVAEHLTTPDAHDARQGVMRIQSAAIPVFWATLMLAPFASAHPGSALVVDQQTKVYFAY